MANEPSSGCPGRVLVPLDKSGSTSAERKLNCEQVRHRRPQDERQGEDLPFNDDGERTPLLNHSSFATVAVALHPASMRLLAPSRGYS